MSVSVSAPKLSIEFPDDITGPQLIVPNKLLREEEKISLSKPEADQKRIAAHLIIHSCLFTYVKKKRAATDQQRISEIENSTKLPDAAVSFSRLAGFIDPNSVGKTIDALIQMRIIRRTKEAIPHVSSARYELTRSAVESGLCCVAPLTKALQKKLLQPRIGRHIDNPSEIESTMFAAVSRLKLRRQIIEEQADDLPFLQRLRLLDTFVTFQTGNGWIVRDSFSGRIHTALSNLPTGWRKYLHFDGLPLSSIDVCNSQMLFAAMLTHQFRPDAADAVELLNLCKSGQFYEHVAQSISELNGERDTAKSRTFAYLFSHPDRMSAAAKPVRDFITDRFPSFAECVSNSKRDDYKQFAADMQRLEKQLVIDVAAAATANTIGTGRMIGSVHDSLVVIAGNDAKIARNQLCAAFGAHDVKPTLKVDLWE